MRWELKGHERGSGVTIFFVFKEGETLVMAYTKRKRKRETERKGKREKEEEEEKEEMKGRDKASFQMGTWT